MKLTMEIQGHYAGFSENQKKPDGTVTHTVIWGTDTNGRYARAIAYGPVAIALSKQISALLGENEVIASKRAVITINGEWQTRIVTKDGKDEKQRSFVARVESDNIPAFKILDGMALEAARLRKDATDALARAEKLRSSGQLAFAYEAVAQFVANYAGVPLDLEKFLADSAADDAEFGAASHGIDPEEAAAAHFAREDRIKDTATPAAEPITEPDVAEQDVVASQADNESEAPQKEAEEFGDFQEVLGAVDETVVNSDENVAEEDAIVIDADGAIDADVLDDGSSVSEVKEPSPQATQSFGSRPSGFGSRPGGFGTPPSTPASKPFSRPEVTRPATQPTARAIPAQEERPSPFPFGGSRSPKF
jgi:hypothetical protein